jgi:hypothetical protein
MNSNKILIYIINYIKVKALKMIIRKVNIIKLIKLFIKWIWVKYHKNMLKKFFKKKKIINKIMN